MEAVGMNAEAGIGGPGISEVLDELTEEIARLREENDGIRSDRDNLMKVLRLADDLLSAPLSSNLVVPRPEDRGIAVAPGSGIDHLIGNVILTCTLGRFMLTNITKLRAEIAELYMLHGEQSEPGEVD
jgi:hypothetical protein